MTRLALRTRTEGDLAIEGSPPRMTNMIGTTNPRVRKLLEPTRRLHSIVNLQLRGSLSDKYKAELVADISKPPASDQEVFQHLLTSSEETFSVFDSRKFASSILELRKTLDELDDARRMHKEPLATKIMEGRYAGFTFHAAYEDIELDIRMKLAYASLKTGDVAIAEKSLILSLVSRRWQDCDVILPGISDVGGAEP